MVCGTGETIETFSPQIALTSDDLPTFGLPTSATNPLRMPRGYGGACQTRGVAGAAWGIDWRRWFDRMQPQTLQIATWLLYFTAFFGAISLVDGRDWLGWMRAVRPGGVAGWALAVAFVAANALAGILMANDRRLGWRVAVAVAVGAFPLRWWTLGGTGLGAYDRLAGGSSLSLVFDVALCALLLHPQSRAHQRTWFR